MTGEVSLSICSQNPGSETDGYSVLAGFYEDIHAGRSAEIDYYVGLVTDDVCNILDIGCGTGVLTFPLEAARRARPSQSGCCIGLDASPAMLAEARRRESGIVWVEGDMRSPPLFGSFDLVTCGLNTFQHLLSDADALAMLRAVAERLAPSGVFAFDIFHPDPMFLVPSRERAFVRAVQSEQGSFDLIEDTRYDPESRILSILWSLPSGGGSSDATFRMRQYWPEHVAALVAQAGLAIEAVHGGFRGEPLGAGQARQVYRCRRLQ